MKDEIKEILEWLNDKDYYIEDFGYKFKRLSLEENEALLDYITNLQEENKKLALELSGYRTAILKDDKLLGLQQRIDKAIEYINEAIENDDYFEDDIATDIKEPSYDKYVNSSSLLRILQGEDK